MPGKPAIDIYDLFDEAAAITDPELREAFIASHCGHDPELAQRLRRMLQVREAADELFDQLPETSSHSTGPKQADIVNLGRVGKFRLERLIGRGGMGNVFLAHDEQLGRPAALKFPRLDSMGDAQVLNRFLREARLAAQLNHPNLVQIYEVGVWGDVAYIASQWCEGGDLAQWLSTHPGPQDPAWSARLIRAVARAVAYCHQQGVLHLDIKPANIILAMDSAGETSGDAADFRPLLTDFGVARVVEQSFTNTHSSLLLGTPLYMAPEQAEGNRDRVGPASDIFALGVVLHELVYGKRPFDGDSPIQVIDRIRRADTLKLPSGRKVPRELRTICERCLQQRPSARYASADALAEDLDRYLRSEPIHARPISRTQHAWRWLERPDRLIQAGWSSMAIHLLFIINFITVFIARAVGWGIADFGDLKVLGQQMVFVALITDIPSIAVAVMTIRLRPWSVPVGILLSLFIFCWILAALIAGASAFSAYENHPLTFYMQHLFAIVAIAVPLAAYLAALPAAIRLWRNPAAAGR